MTEIILNVPKGHTMICGWNGHAMEILSQLRAAGKFVVVVARERPQELKNLSVPFIQGDSTKDSVLKLAGVETASSAIILAEDRETLPSDIIDARSILTALAIESLHPEIYSCMEILNPDNARHARNSNVDNVIFCDQIIADFIALFASQRGISDFVNNIFCYSDNRSSLNAVSVGPEWEGKTIGELFDAIRKRRHLPLAVTRPLAKEGREIWRHKTNPAPSEVIKLPMKVIYIRCEK